MKLLFDQNLPHVLADRLQDVFAGSTHVRNLGLHRAADETVWNYARENDFTIVSKDSDFHQRSFLFGAPPKAIWIRRGNCATEDILKILRTRHTEILNFDKDPAAAFLILE